MVTPDADGKPIPCANPAASWEADITPEEIERRLAGPFVTFDELKKRLGWECSPGHPDLGEIAEGDQRRK